MEKNEIGALLWDGDSHLETRTTSLKWMFGKITMSQVKVWFIIQLEQPLQTWLLRISSSDIHPKKHETQMEKKCEHLSNGQKDLGEFFWRAPSLVDPQGTIFFLFVWTTPFCCWDKSFFPPAGGVGVSPDDVGYIWYTDLRSLEKWQSFRLKVFGKNTYPPTKT